MKTNAYFIALLVFLLMFTSCSLVEKDDTFYDIYISNESDYKLWVEWESVEGKGQRMLEPKDNPNDGFGLYGKSIRDVGNLGTWKEEQFKEAIQSVRIQRVTIQGDTLDSVPLDFSEFKYWGVMYKKSYFMWDTWHEHECRLSCTDSLLNQ